MLGNKDKNMEHPVLLEACDLSLQRGSFHLKDISFQVYSNEILAIIGKNGAGKTLLLESIAGFQHISQGKLLFEGSSLNELPLHQRKIGYLYQDYCLFPHMSAKENIAYGLKCKKVPKKEISYQVEQIAAELGITSILEQYPATLSGGEQQRVALARALVTKPELLLLDEPFSALDPVTKYKMHELILKIHRDFSCTIVFVTHDFQEAEKLADRIGILYHGHLRGIVQSDKLFVSEWDSDIRKFLGKE